MECPFCQFDKEIKYRLLHQTEHFYLFPTVGAFIEGYLLITTKEHFANFSNLPPAWFEELEYLEKIATKFLREKYGADVVEFEHGPCASGGEKAGNCIDHAHLAIVATNHKPHAAIVAQLGKGEKISSLKELAQLYRNRGLSAYLLYKDKERIIYWPTPKIISQYIRRLLADGPHFDWRAHDFKDNIAKVKDKWHHWLVR